MIGIPSYSGLIPGVMVQSILQLRKPLPCGFLCIERQRIDKARNAFVKEALKKDFDYLFMVDDDNPIPPDTLEKFIEDDKDIVIAPILSRNKNAEGVHTLCAYYAYEKTIENESLTMYRHITTFRDGGPLHKIDGGGTGCILIKRNVLEKISEEYENPFEFGDITVEGQRRTMSEDMEFCERATKLGFEIWLDDRIRPVHISGVKSVQWS